MRINTDPGSPSDLPFGWVEQHDAASGRVYWLHVPTDRSEYRRPRRPLPPEPLPSSDVSPESAPVPLSASPRISTSPRLPSSPRNTRPTSSASLPGISNTLNTYRPSLQTRVESSSSLASTGSAAVRSPPPPYEVGSTSSNVNSLSQRRSPPLVPLQSSPSLRGQTSPPAQQPPPRLPSPGSPAVAGPSRSPSASTGDLRTSINPTQTQQGHTSSRVASPGSLSPPSQPLSGPDLRSLQHRTSPRHTPGAPIFSNMTTPATPFTPDPNGPSPQWTPLSPLPPLPPIPPELRAERNANTSRRNVAPRSASADTAWNRTGGQGHPPQRTLSDPIPGNHDASAHLNALDRDRPASPFLTVPHSPGPADIRGPRSEDPSVPSFLYLPRDTRSSIFQPPPMSPSATSDRSSASGTTVAMDPYSFEPNRPTSSLANLHGSTASVPPRRSSDGQERSFRDARHEPDSGRPGDNAALSPGLHERTRRPYIVTTPSIIAPPEPSAWRTSLSPRSGFTSFPLRDSTGRDSSNSANRDGDFPSSPNQQDSYSERGASEPRRRNSRHTGLTPDIEEMSSYSTSPVSPRHRSRGQHLPHDGPASPRRSNTYPSTPYHSARDTYGPSAYPPSVHGSVESPSNDVFPPNGPDIESIIRDSLPNPPRSSSFNADAERLSNAARDAERFASDLSNQLNSSGSRSQQLLNDLYKVKLERAQQKIDALQEKLADIGHRDAQLERELRREQDELKDWEIARLDDGIMDDLGKLTEAEYARLKRELDREMTLDQLQERLSQYEPLHYDHDPFDPQGLYTRLSPLPPLQSQRPIRHRTAFPHPASLDYSSDCDCHYPSLSSVGRPPNKSYGSMPYAGCMHHCSNFGNQPFDPIRQPYSHASQARMDRLRRGRQAGSVFDDDGDDHSSLLSGDYPRSGYSSSDDQMFGTPRMAPPSLSRRRSTSSMMPRPILRRGNHGLDASRRRQRRVSFEAEPDFSPIFRTAPGFLSPATFR